MTNNWKDIHPKFTGMLQQGWEDKGFTYEQTQDWINIGLTPWDADFCAWLEQGGYTALAVLNYEDAEQLRSEYQESLISKPLFDWYLDGKLTINQFSCLSNKLGIKAVNNITLTQLNNLLLTANIPTKPNYPIIKIILVLILITFTVYLITN